MSSEGPGKGPGATGRRRGHWRRDVCPQELSAQLQLKPQGGPGCVAGDEGGSCCPCVLWLNPCSVLWRKTRCLSLWLFSWTHVQLFAIPWAAARQAFLSFTVSWSLLKFTSIGSVMPSDHLIFCHPLLLPPSACPSIEVFSNELALCIRWPGSLHFPTIAVRT